MSNNRMVGEFMVPNWEDLKSEDYDGTVDAKDLHTAVCLCSGNDEDLRYERSWNALMPVVKKCLDITDKQDLRGWNSTIAESLKSVCREVVFKEVCGFIEWYSKQQLNNKPNK